jgi:hypothetical protein
LAVKWLAAGALVAFGLAMCRIATSGWWPTAAALAVLAASPLVGIVLGLISRPDLSAAARRIDDRYQLDDRTVTSVAVMRQPAGTGAASPLAQILLRETTQRHKQVKAGEVVPWRLPRGILAALLLSVFAALVALAPLDLESYLPGESDDPSASAVTNGRAAAFTAPPQASPLSTAYTRRHTSRGAPVLDENPQLSPSLERGVVVERYFAAAENPHAEEPNEP